MSEKVKCDNCTFEIDREHLHRHRIGNYDDLYKCVICGKVLTVGTTQYERLMADMTVEKISFAYAAMEYVDFKMLFDKELRAELEEKRLKAIEHLNSEVSDE